MSQPEVELKQSTVDRFLSKVRPVGECLEWQGYSLKRKWSGYGIITMNRKQYRTHRFAWIIKNGFIPDKLCVLHKCDNQKCVNPEHLFLGTLVDNNLDRDKKNRNVAVYGDKNGNSKLTVEAVKMIKAYIKDDYSYAWIAKQFGVRWQNIQAIAKGRTWKNV